MTGPNDPPLTRWAGITEPTTVITNVILSFAAFVFAARLGIQAAADGSGAGSSIAGGFVATALAAAFGAAAHGLDPASDAVARARCWKAALYSAGLVGVGAIASVAFFAARGAMRSVIVAFGLIKLGLFVIAVTRRPEFRVVAIDYGAALLVLLAGACYGLVRWQEPGATWIIAGVVVSLIAGLVQAFRVAPHRWFNHNDLFHIIELGALYLFFRGGLLLVDR